MASLNKASKKYLSLNRDALRLISNDGGLFMTCSCSSAMTQKDGGNFFLQTVQQASLGAKREVTLLQVNGAAPCHTQSPASFPAGNYLTAAIFYVHAKKD
jgi:23S rRNA G2069 N7-methylase RlmK/C1962 C5-methylase RlmI